ncbi:hypothetical protein I6B53_03390 [Schaalia sp. 19OD2882]|uniref:hypothetical protein n=1 Tax=Schaalia sp. 19OD2882 TaxID=2794089 RepID=UPI001C1F12D8|nr:hypothetical protein [Schaalia sp. 19OD2882]QWW20155.1 hypothetical protein I6B53_03390 [Schaalia sp. 19OD2882]
MTSYEELFCRSRRVWRQVDLDVTEVVEEVEKLTKRLATASQGMPLLFEDPPRSVNAKSQGQRRARRNLEYLDAQFAKVARVAEANRAQMRERFAGSSLRLGQNVGQADSARLDLDEVHEGLSSNAPAGVLSDPGVDQVIVETVGRPDHVLGGAEPEAGPEQDRAEVGVLVVADGDLDGEVLIAGELQGPGGDLGPDGRGELEIHDSSSSVGGSVVGASNPTEEEPSGSVPEKSGYAAYARVIPGQVTADDLPWALRVKVDKAAIDEVVDRALRIKESQGLTLEVARAAMHVGAVEALTWSGFLWSKYEGETVLFGIHRIPAEIADRLVEFVDEALAHTRLMPFGTGRPEFVATRVARGVARMALAWADEHKGQW